MRLRASTRKKGTYMLTMDQVTQLMNKNASARNAPAQWFDGNVWHSTKTPAGSRSGSFVGKSGSIRRSAKGRTRRMPDGRRAYIIDHDSTVVAYKA